MDNRNGQPLGFLDVIYSAWVLLPFTAGVTIGVFAWLLGKDGPYIALPCVAGVLVAIGAAVRLRIGGTAGKLDPILARRRQELLNDLEAMIKPGRGGCPETELTGTPAQTEA